MRRTDGRSLGTFWREEVAAPWRLDFHIGVGEAERSRIQELTGEIPGGGSALYLLATSNPPGVQDLEVVNSEDWRAAEIPAVNGHGTAGAVARFYAGLLAGGELDGVRLVARQTVAAMTAGELSGPDLVFEEDVTWGLGVSVEPDATGWAVSGARWAWPTPRSASPRRASRAAWAVTSAPRAWTPRSGRRSTEPVDRTVPLFGWLGGSPPGQVQLSRADLVSRTAAQL